MDLGLVFPPCLFQSAWAFWHVSSMGLWCDELAFISLLTYPFLPFQSCVPGFVCFLFSYRGAIPHAPSSPFSFFVLLSLYFFKNVSPCLVILEEKERNPCFILPCLIMGPGPVHSALSLQKEHSSPVLPGTSTLPMACVQCRFRLGREGLACMLFVGV